MAPNELQATCEAFASWQRWRAPSKVQPAAERVRLSLNACAENPDRPSFVWMLADDVAKLEQAITHSSKASSH
jgi:hypothetical protein